MLKSGVQYPVSEPADDLVSLVRSLFYLQHPFMEVELSAVPQNSYEAIESVWDKWMKSKIKWIAAQDSAVAADYQRVKMQLSDLLDI